VASAGSAAAAAQPQGAGQVTQLDAIAGHVEHRDHRGHRVARGGGRAAQLLEDLRPLVEALRPAEHQVQRVERLFQRIRGTQIAGEGDGAPQQALRLLGGEHRLEIPEAGEQLRLQLRRGRGEALQCLDHRGTRQVVAHAPFRELAQADGRLGKGLGRVEGAGQLERLAEDAPALPALAGEAVGFAQGDQRLQAPRVVRVIQMIQGVERLGVMLGGLLVSAGPEGLLRRAGGAGVGALRITHRQGAMVVVGQLTQHALRHLAVALLELSRDAVMQAHTRSGGQGLVGGLAEEVVDEAKARRLLRAGLDHTGAHRGVEQVEGLLARDLRGGRGQGQRELAADRRGGTDQAGAAFVQPVAAAPTRAGPDPRRSPRCGGRPRAGRAAARRCARAAARPACGPDGRAASSPAPPPLRCRASPG